MGDVTNHQLLSPWQQPGVLVWAEAKVLTKILLISSRRSHWTTWTRRRFPTGGSERWTSVGVIKLRTKMTCYPNSVSYRSSAWATVCWATKVGALKLEQRTALNRKVTYLDGHQSWMMIPYVRSRGVRLEFVPFLNCRDESRRAQLWSKF